MSKLILKSATLAVLALLACTASGTIAYGVTPAAPVAGDASALTVTTGAAVRARADVQIRRIKSLIITKKSDTDADFERLEKLQKELRGER